MEIPRAGSEHVRNLAPHLLRRYEPEALREAIASSSFRWMAEVKTSDDFLQSLARLSPAFGMIGTIMGLVDLFREKFPNLRAYSWWDYRGGAFHRNQGLRIDLLLGTRSVLTRLRSVEIDRDYRKKKDGLTASDHAPVIADLE